MFNTCMSNMIECHQDVHLYRPVSGPLDNPTLTRTVQRLSAYMNL